MDRLLTGVRAARAASPGGRFVRALVLPLRATAFLARQPRLWPLVIVPALINVVLFVGAAAVVVWNADNLLGTFWARPAVDAWYAWGMLALWYLAWFAALLLGLVLAYVVVLLVGGIVASPFNDVLSERTEMLLTGRSEMPQGGTGFWGGVLHSIGSTTAITGLYLALMLPVLLLNVVPGVGSMAATVVGSVVGAFFVALEYADTTFERYGYRLRDKVALLRRHAALAGGFGLGTGLLLWIPFINFLCIPIAVVGGTALALALHPPADLDGHG